MTSRDLSIFNTLRPFSIGFDDMFDQFENMLGNGGLTMQSNYPPYNIRKTGKDNYAIEVALAGFNKNDVEVEFDLHWHHHCVAERSASWKNGDFGNRV